MNPDNSTDKLANPAGASVPSLPKPVPPSPTNPVTATSPVPNSPDLPVPPVEEVTPVASAIGEIASQPEVDDSAIPSSTTSEPAMPGLPPAPDTSGLPPAPTSGAPKIDLDAAQAEAANIDSPKPGDAVGASNPATPTDPSQPSGNTQPLTDNKTVKLPVPTSVLPALAIGVLVLVLLAAVAALAFLG